MTGVARAAIHVSTRGECILSTSRKGVVLKITGWPLFVPDLSR